MIGFITFVLAFAISGLFFRAFKGSTYRDSNSGRFKAQNLWRLFVAFGLAWFIALINPIDIERIEAGH